MVLLGDSYHFSAAVLLLVAGCAAAAPVHDSASRVSVTFIEPEKFTDARRAELGADIVGSPSASCKNF